MKKFNTHIKDRHFQEIHHALGCPWPEEVMGETYRNYFAVGECSDIAKRMKASPHWSDGCFRFGNLSFSVTTAGRKALYEYMTASLYVPARFAITFHRYEGEMVVSAKSRSAAKYRAYLNSDTDTPFGEFVSEIKSVKIRSRAINPELAA
ncbi:hypothetical protein J7400_19020 [Shimia sp. R9_2]|uniref:hypothetical protein n=1 Tax=Shimia sp. R9_2 TaxID=2821112 RepID=UPI001AD98066|nr:hypothetical protein [Shimia sp. R9_2]MBO9398770.1 hypothetical protein [Shimia sp. R9_2]